MAGTRQDRHSSLVQAAFSEESIWIRGVIVVFRQTIRPCAAKIVRCSTTCAETIGDS